MFAWAADLDGCGYYRAALPMQALAAQGHDALAWPDLPLGAMPWQVVIGQRVVREDASTVWQRMAAEGKPLVLELDDDLWHIPEHNPAHGFYDAAKLALLEENIAAATMVTTTTEPLAAVIRNHHPHVRVIPNYIDAALLAMQRPRREKVTIGWAGSATHRQDFEACRRPLRRLLASRPNVDLHMVGTDYRKLAGRPDGRFSEWVRPTPAYYSLLDFDIGIAPLVDNTFNRSKSPIKALEYAALGIPVVASNVGPYAEFVEHGVTGFLCESEADWSRYLRLLTQDADLRDLMGRAARIKAHAWTIQAHADEWLKVADEALRRRTRDRVPV